MKHSLHEDLKSVHMLDAASYGAAAEAFSGEVDCKGFDELLVVINCGAFTATGDVVFQAEESDSSGSGFADISGAAIAEKVAADDQKTYLLRIDLRKRKRYIRVGYDVDDDACIFGISGILGGAQNKPVTQENAVVSV